jgi:hypothetical protein
MAPICASRHSSSANQAGYLRIKLRAHHASDDDVMRAFEGAVPAAMFNHARGESGADGRQALQFFDRCGVVVDALFIVMLGN